MRVGCISIGNISKQRNLIGRRLDLRQPTSLTAFRRS